ncbi:NYN domain-containing protein [Ktedonobacteria bacterium brp13]|nr:NYN domain-containing protein [Ktedonobacteria bacterium brp13]
MTTHNTHHEQNDVDASVVENSSAPENVTTVNPAASEVIELGEDVATPASEVTSSSDEHTDTLQVSTETDAATQSIENATSEDASSASVLSLTNIQATATDTPDTADAVNAVSATDDTQSEQGKGNESDSSHKESEETFSPFGSPEISSIAHSIEASDNPEVFPIELHDETTAEFSGPLAEETATEPSTTADAVQETQAQNLWEAPFFTLDPVQAIPASQSSTTDAPSVEPAHASVEASEGQASTEDAEVTETPEHAPTSNVKSEEVRPFTDFIAEFRQAEAAARGNQSGALSILSDLVVGGNLPETPAVAVESNVVDSVALSAEVPESERGYDVQNKNVKEETMKVADETEGRQEEPEQTSSQDVEQPVARPVSPLLRPPSRLRMPRHSVNRHLREEIQAPLPVENQSSASVESNQTEASTAASETPAEQPAPRPARRYRFDRPAASHITRDSSTTPTFGAASPSNKPAATPASQADVSSVEASQQKSEEKHSSAAIQPTAEEAKHGVNGQLNNNNNGVHQASETPAKKHTSTQEKESENATSETPTTPVTEHVTGSRRRHSKEKEPQAPQATPVQESTPGAPIVETPAPALQKQQEQIAPEDLPPLEYSELQKASSRRRRRHRSSTSPATPNVASSPAINSASMNNSNMNSTSIPPSPVATPAPTPAPAPVTPPARSLPAASVNPYAIVSGYTLNQMNQQSSELSGPFMGPDPSPARGSVIMRDGRNTRAEARPTSPIYPSSRSADSGGLSTAAMTQFANIVSQALQQQTDRMVAEFRRMNQAPTNVSVTLPPFPSTERVGVFVDVANLLYSARTLRMTVHFGKLLDFLRGNRRLVRAHAYCPTSPQAGEEQMFLQAVKGLGYRITTKNYKTFSSGAKKADLDLDLCMDVVRLVDGGAVDCVVLVSGDSDFMPMLDYCSDHGVRVEVAAFDEAMSATLRQSCDLFINLSMLLDEIRG